MDLHSTIAYYPVSMLSSSPLSAAGADRPSLRDTLRHRWQLLATHVPFPVVLWSGGTCARNFPANSYPYRASSHFLYFAGLPLANAAIRLESGRLELFLDDPTPASILWHGVTPSREQVAADIGADAAYPMAQLQSRIADAATIPVQDITTRQQQSLWHGRPLESALTVQGEDAALAAAIVALRLHQDAGAIAELRQAAAVTVAAHQAGMRATAVATREAQVRAAMEQVILAQDMTPAYSSIVTVHGEVLHSDRYDQALQAGDLLLADVGAETTLGWAADVTRTWPVSGRFSPTQRDLYDVVLAAHDRGIDQAKPGVEYRSLHLTVAQVMTEGLVELGILRGRAEDLVEQDVHTLFFPHGVGHLLGLDVHDMEDLGDLAGYAPGRQRSDRFGLCYLRLDRPLAPGMVVTIEPGFYQISLLLTDPERRARFQDWINWERLAQFADVRGIRIEDDVLITDTEPEILTAALPTQRSAIEALVAG